MLGHNQRDGIFLSTTRTRKQRRGEEDSAMAALMRSTGEEIEESCRLVRDVIARQKTKRETTLKFKEEWKRK